MVVVLIGKVLECFWFCMVDSNWICILFCVFVKGLDMIVYMGLIMDQDGFVVIIVVDDVYLVYIVQVKLNVVLG